MNYLASAVRIAIGNAIAATRVDVEYTADAQTLKFVAGFGTSRETALPLDGQPVRLQDEDSRQLLVWPESLEIDGVFREPEAGDLAVVTLPSGETVTIEVTANPPESAWRWTDRFHTAIRINCKMR